MTKPVPVRSSGTGLRPWRSLRRLPRAIVVLAPAVGGLSGPALAFQPSELVLGSGHLALRFAPAPNGTVAVSLASDAGGSAAEQVIVSPVQLLVCQAAAAGSGTCTSSAADADQPVINGTYDGVTSANGSITAEAFVSSPAGSQFKVRDIYRAGKAADTITLDRTVIVLSAAAPDVGFNSGLTLGFAAPEPIATTPVFAPGIWYDLNTWAPRNGFGRFGFNGISNFAYWRETRSGLPLVAIQDPNTGYTMALVHTGATPTSVSDDHSPSWLVDPSVRYGSLGVGKVPQTSIGFIYPAEEDDGDPGTQSTAWVRRSHPVQMGFSHSYELTFSLDRYAPNGVADYDAAMSGAWRKFYAAFDPRPADVPIDQVFDDQIALLAAESADWSPGAPGFPFQVPVSTGAPDSPIAYQMGYTGQQIPAAYQLLRAGLLHDQPQVFAKGKAQLDFWASNADVAGYSAGLPDTIFTVGTTASPSGWLDDGCKWPLFIRSLSDGMEGALNAAIFMREHGKPQAGWERFAQSFGDWLVSHQNADGSFYREYNRDGTVFVASAACQAFGAGNNRLATTDPIRFLVTLYFATNDTRYLTSAESAGAFALQAIYRTENYVGGTSSYDKATLEPVLDREAGFQAIHAALALYDATHQDAWLAAARKAANYAETWLYVQNFRLNGAPPAVAYAGTRAFSLVVAGASTADIGLSFESYDFFRLHLLGDDASNHYLKIAQLIQNNSKLTTQLGANSRQRFGYAAPGLVGEADDVVYLSYVQSASAMNWLPWLSEAEIEPIQRMQDTFGASTVEGAERQSPQQLGVENAHIYPAPGSIGWGH